MKIAVWHNLPSGGAKRALFNHVRGLVARGHRVEAWCPPTADQTYLPLSEIIREHVVPLQEGRRTGDWQDVRRKLTGGLEVRANVHAMQAHSQECAQQMAQSGFDLLFANSCQAFAAPFIGRYVSLPKVLYLQEPFREFYEARPEQVWIVPDTYALRGPIAQVKALRKLQNQRVQAREELTNARAFDTLLVNSYFSRESLLRAYNLSAQVCYLGIDTELFGGQEPPTREDFVVGVGSFQQGKNIGFVVDAVAALPMPRPRLVWVGNSDFGGYLEQMAARAQRQGVVFEPHLRATDAEIVGLLHRAFAMVYAPCLEPFGFAPLEAGACGLPVVGVAEGGVRETVRDGENGLLVSPDPRAMAAGIDALRTDPACARALGRCGRQQVQEQWSVSASIDRLEQHLLQTRDQQREEKNKSCPIHA